MDITISPLSGRFRREHDLLGEKDIPVEYYFGIQTMRAIENFDIGRVRLHFYPELIRALAMVKEAAARANGDLGLLDGPTARAIVDACREIEQGRLHEHFVVDMVQGGAGTSTNMNANEVIANRTLELLGHERGEYGYCHPNNHVNRSQSTNDAYPTAVRIALIFSLQKLVETLRWLVDAFRAKGAEFAHVIKMGRTQLQDAVPMTLGQEFEAYAANLSEEIDRIEQNYRLFLEVNMGATAIGTGINADPDYSPLCIRYLREITGLPVVAATNLIEATNDTGAFIMNSSALKRLATKMSKICNDLRLLSSGPRAGLGEINLPPMQNGSSIMPGKINPVIPEVVTQVAFHVIGNDTTITMAAEAGQMELNAFEPVVFYSLFSSITSMTGAVNTLVKNCILGITANEKRCEDLVSKSVGITTALCPYIGYQKAASIAKKSLKTGESVTSLVLKDELLTQKQLDDILDPYALTGPELPAEDDLAG